VDLEPEIKLVALSWVYSDAEVVPESARPRTRPVKLRDKVQMSQPWFGDQEKKNKNDLVVSKMIRRNRKMWL